jgi:hypothetical protein
MNTEKSASRRKKTLSQIFKHTPNTEWREKTTAAKVLYQRKVFVSNDIQEEEEEESTTTDVKEDTV